jgi:hypothetical protein
MFCLATRRGEAQVSVMRTDFALFRERLAEACAARDRMEADICRQIGLGSRRAITLALTGPNAIDLWRLAQIADVLDVSLDWLTGRSNVMDVMEMPELRGPAPSAQQPKRKAKKVP